MRPEFTEREAQSLASSLYGLNATIKALDSYSDQNFLVSTPDARFVLKIANSAEPFQVLDFQQQALQHLGVHASHLTLPYVVPAKK